MKKREISLITCGVSILLVFSYVGEQRGNTFHPGDVPYIEATLKERTDFESINPQEVKEEKFDIKPMMKAELSDEQRRNEDTYVSDAEISNKQPNTQQPNEPDKSQSDQQLEDHVPETLNVGFVIDTNGMILRFNDGDDSVNDEYLELPSEGCIGIVADTFANYTGVISEIYIPENVTNIQFRAFAGLGDLQWLEVSEMNGNATSVDGIVFDENVTAMIAFPSARTGIYSVPDSLSYIGDGALYNTHLSRIDLLCVGYVEIHPNAFGPNQGAGLTLRVPAKLLSQYQEALVNTQVQIEGVGG